ncbi:hypothetical protein [Hymenobacter cellulosivorans]|uniref:Holin n=1 Tax=Hymenobacter cellulosivorans TaxID=2932249 RepID=A0ABY4F946_9BACT|nr:hypothetical protein [Hymenobacter cellulosivorans]UOQ53038.1 hypothetical protein MUN80_25290 [Hymenobacter cellulosivorans]
MKFLLHTLSELYKLLGFRGVRDFAASALGLKTYTLPVFGIQVSGTLLAAIVAFCAKWIWNPPLALLVLTALEVANTVYGIKVARQVKKEPVTWAKFERIFGKLMAMLLVLTVVRNTINSYPYYDMLADLIFGWFFSTKLRKVVSKMVALKVAEGGLPKIIQAFVQSIINSKYGPALVDVAQGVTPAAEQPTPETPTEPAPVVPAP